MMMSKYIVEVKDQAMYIADDERVFVTGYEYMVKDGEVIAYPTGHTEDINEAIGIPYHEALEVAKSCDGIVYDSENVPLVQYDSFYDKQGFRYVIETVINKVKGWLQ